MSSVISDATPRRPSREPPDFVLDLNGKHIGVELTKVFADSDAPSAVRGSKRKEHASQRSKICNMVREFAERRRLPSLLVSIGFAVEEVRARALLAERIVDLVATHQPRNDGLAKVKRPQYLDRELSGAVWPEELDYLLILRDPAQVGMFVTHDDPDWVRGNCVGVLQHAIDDKEPDLVRYSESCDERWLLIHADGDAACSFIEPDEETKSHICPTSFDRVFYFRVIFPDWFELRTITR